LSWTQPTYTPDTDEKIERAVATDKDGRLYVVNDNDAKEELMPLKAAEDSAPRLALSGAAEHQQNRRMG
jgi:hypothetical protein